MWGIGCSLAILYSVYLGGYRKAAEDSLAATKTKRFREAIRKIEQRRNQKAAATSVAIARRPPPE
jgi:hypothetical protein